MDPARDRDELQLMSNSDIQESLPQQGLFNLEVTVFRAHGLPRPTFLFGKKRSFYVTLTCGRTIKRTTAIQSEEQAVEWNEKLEAFDLVPSARISLSLSFKRSRHEDVLIGILDVPLESQNNASFLLNNVGSAPRVRLYLTINLLKNSSSSTTAVNPPNPTSNRVDATAAAPGPASLILAPVAEVSGDHLPLGTSLPPTLDSQVEVSNATAEEALRGASNAMQVMNCYETWEKALGRIQWVMNSLSSLAELHPYAKVAVGLILVIPTTFLVQIQRDAKVKELLNAIHDAFDFAQDASPLQNINPVSKQANLLVLMLRHVGNCCDFIQSYSQDRNFLMRFMKNAGSQADKQISDLCSTFVELRKSFLDQAGLITEISVFQILDDVGVVSAQVSGISTRQDKIITQLSNQISDLDLEQKMREIPYRGRWRAGTERSYIPGTRKEFLEYIANWAISPDSKPGLVLFGQAGTGKSSIAYEIARRFQAMNRLTSYFTFLRAEQIKREDYHLFTTIAHDLSKRYPSFKTALGRVIRDDKSLRTAQQYSPLFESMLLEPLKDVHIVSPVLIIIDGLDESGDVTGPKGLHAFLAEHLSQLPANFRILITSRLETHIVRQFDKFGAAFDIIHMDDSELAAGTGNDIRVYLRTNLSPDTFGKYGNELAKKAEGLFQWVAVGCGYINSPPNGLTAEDCVHGLLADRPDLVEVGQDLSPLNELYKGVLEGYFKADIVRRRFRSVIGQLLAAFEPLSIQSLAALRYHSVSEQNVQDSVVAIVTPLGSLLSNVTSTERTLPIVPLHTSFRDFLTNQQLSGPFYVDLGEAHRQLARSCLGLMVENLKFNICELPSSYYPNNKINDLQSRVDKHIPSPLFYACRLWDDHLERAKFGLDLLAQVRSLFEEKFLFWLEVLSLKNSLGLATPALATLNAWLTSGRQSESVLDELTRLQALVIDAGSFVRYFGMTIARSAPHIYVSALPFSPTTSWVAKQYSSIFPNTLRLTRGQLSHWPAGIELNIPIKRSCTSVTISPDGQWIVSGSADGTIHMWNAITGEMEGSPLIGHIDSVDSVAFSPDGQWIVSGSHDRTIRVWNATTAQIEGSPFTGHTSAVESVAFSPDGQHIVSCSRDGTIRLWNVTTGPMEGSPFIWQTGSVNSVAFFPDGRHIACGSDDRTVCMWNTTTGQMEGRPFTGHTGSVTSVAVSPRGNQIVSGSVDNTIRVWNVTTGQMEGIPFTGHKGWVMSVAFSPDGQRIVSGSWDRTIRVWNATTGQTEGSPFAGYTGSAVSVTFSPDGQRIVSGWNDGAIRVWNATTGHMESSPPATHSDSVNSVAFAPDGQRVVSGSSDDTVRMWNATTGELEGSSLTAHAGPVYCVAFSPDGQQIISGSHHGTLHMWNATTGQMQGNPFTRHTKSVESVAFSPDGQRIVSGSHDRTIRVWDATTAQIEGDPITGHSNWVVSVAFSPDGQRIVSGSWDCTIRMWNATTREIEGSPLIGHSHEVLCVAFSPDGRRIVSGAYDGTMHMWSVATGQMEGGTLTGHTAAVQSVAFSPDGQHIVSGSYDGSICVWNATTAQIEGSPFTGHTSWVNSVAFSPDGLRIVSGSSDHTIRVWNAFNIATANDTAYQTPFTDCSRIDDDGWIRATTDGELLLWIPTIHRQCLHRPSNIWIAGTHETRLDFSNFVFGPEWVSCYKGR